MGKGQNIKWVGKEVKCLPQPSLPYLGTKETHLSIVRVTCASTGPDLHRHESGLLFLRGLRWDTSGWTENAALRGLPCGGLLQRVVPEEALDNGAQPRV